jgi:uncharacterized membrane protein YeaQ/YmgE (transglycosylase-associated protein family)
MTKKAASNTPPSEWEQLREMTDLHKFYFELIIKNTTFIFGIIGAIISYLVTSDFQDTHRLWIALFIPISLSIGTGSIGIIGAIKAYELSKKVKEKQHILGLSWRPHAEILPMSLAGLALLFFVIALTLILVILNPQLWSEFVTNLNP